MPAHIGFFSKASSLAFWVKSQNHRGQRRHFKGLYKNRRNAAMGASELAHLTTGDKPTIQFDDRTKWHDYIINPLDAYDMYRAAKLDNRYLGGSDKAWVGNNKFNHADHMIEKYSDYRKAIDRLNPAKPNANAKGQISANEWELYFRQGSEFDDEIHGLFDMEYKLLVILSKGRPRHIKRIEAAHENLKEPLIVWTHA